jgi:hypothetical protein
MKERLVGRSESTPQTKEEIAPKRQKHKRHGRRRHEDGISRKRPEMHVRTYRMVIFHERGTYRMVLLLLHDLHHIHSISHCSPQVTSHRFTTTAGLQQGPEVLPHRKAWPSPMRLFSPSRHAGRPWARGTLPLWCCRGPRRNGPAAQELLSAYS